MKLRNKKTGEITTKIDVSQSGDIFWVLCKSPRMYDTLAELNEDWEDYDEAIEDRGGRMSRCRRETIVNITQGWGVGEESIDIILPEGCTDWFVTDYDGSESLWYVLGGKLYNEDHKRIDHEGAEKEKEEE